MSCISLFSVCKYNRKFMIPKYGNTVDVRLIIFYSMFELISLTKFDLRIIVQKIIFFTTLIGYYLNCNKVISDFINRLSFGFNTIYTYLDAREN